MSKYEPLRLYLEGIPDSISERCFTFAELEAILGFKLPASAHNYQAWWANQSKYEGRPQAETWMIADWRVEGVGLNDKWVRFRRYISRTKTNQCNLVKGRTGMV